MSLRNEDKNPFIGLWRSSAMEKMPYTDDFPEALLVTPEFWDGAVGQGKATHITTTITALASGLYNLSVTDNGGGIMNERRLKSWAASKSNDLLHQNGHGTKKALTKYARDYEKATWSIKWRIAKKNLQVMAPPWEGIDTHIDELDDDTTTLMPSGTQIEVEFEPSVLGKFKASSTDLANAIREIITTRYSEETLQRVEFTVDIHLPLPQKPVTLNSRRERWHSFQWHVDDWAKKAKADEIVHVCDHTEPIDGGSWTLNAYLMRMNGNCSYDLKAPNRFPFYGKKDMNRARVHISLDGRMIEAEYIHRYMGSETPHNRFNGMLWFVNFVPTTNTLEDFRKMPKPSTTKVSFYEEDEVMKTFRAVIKQKYDAGHAKFVKAEEAEEEKQRAQQLAVQQAEIARRKAEDAQKKALQPSTKVPIKKKAEVAQPPRPMVPIPMVSATNPLPSPSSAPSQSDILSEVYDIVSAINLAQLEDFIGGVSSEPNDSLKSTMEALQHVKETLSLLGILQAT